MTDLEQLRAEVEALKARVAALEVRPYFRPPYYPAPYTPPAPPINPRQPVCHPPGWTFMTAGDLKARGAAG
jgi:hypothetical protein